MKQMKTDSDTTMMNENQNNHDDFTNNLQAIENHENEALDQHSGMIDRRIAHDCIEENKPFHSTNDFSVTAVDSTVDTELLPGDINQLQRIEAEIQRESDIDTPPNADVQSSHANKEDTTSRSTNGASTCEIQTVIKSMENLRAAISEVVAFPTYVNYSRLLFHAKSTYSTFTGFSRVVEMGENKMSLRESEPISIDQESRSKLNAFGTHFWNTIQKYPVLFLDTYAGKDSKACSREGSTAKSDTTDESAELELCRAIASGFIRALACRLILISKFHTKGHEVPQLITSAITTETDQPASGASTPLALMSELEYGLKVFTRAGKALVSYSDEHHSEAYDILSLATVCWSGIRMSNVATDEDYMFVEAFDALLLLSDCAMKLSLKDTNKISQPGCTNMTGKDIDCPKSDQDEEKGNVSSQKVIQHLQSLEEFVNNQLDLVVDERQRGKLSSKAKASLLVNQHYLPSLARICYKHGNRFARIQDHAAAQEALRISLSATDRCLVRIRQDRRAISETNSVFSSQIQEQEMLVISKQSYHVLSHVLRSIKKFEDSGKCLDCIEVCIEDQKKYDELLYNKTFAQLSAMEKSSKMNQSSSAFALEGPKRQDAEEIKARARLAKHKSKVGEICERMYLAFSRIDLRQKSCIALAVDDDEYIERQFMAMIEYWKKLLDESTDDLHGVSGSFRLERALDSDKAGEMFRLILSCARSIASRRLSTTEIEPSLYSDPYGVLAEATSADNSRQITVYLESLQAIIMAAKKAYDNTDQLSVQLRTELDGKAIRMGKKVTSILRTLFDVAHSKASKRIRSDSTLFPTKENSQTDDLDSLFHNVCDCFTKALSLYQGHEECSEQTIEWCDVLIEIIQQSRQTVFPTKKGDAHQVRYHNTVAGIMAIKAYAESTYGSYGSALKTARSAWENDGSDLGCLSTLFYCSMRHELFSNSDVKHRKEKTLSCSFPNTFLELDHALDVYLSLSKLETLNVIQSLENLLSSFPVMCKLAMGHEILIMGLQKRMIRLTIEIASTIMSSCNLEEFVVKKQTFTLFDLTCSYLASFDDMFPQYIKGENDKTTSEELICLQNIIQTTLNLLVKIRDVTKKNKHETVKDIVFHDVPSFLDNAAAKDMPYYEESHSLYDTSFVKSYIGGQNECLWIAEELWNITNRIMTADACLKTKRGVSQCVSELLTAAHDFALLSEEEHNAHLTRGHLACESFESEVYSIPYIDFTSEKMKGTDLASEFSAQCLLSAVANMIDFINVDAHQDGSDHSLDIVAKARKWMIVAITELRTLDLLESPNIVSAVGWLTLNLLISTKDDDACSQSLSRGGLFEKLKMIMDNSPHGYQNKVADGEGIEDKSDLEQLYLLANKAHQFDMRLSARQLLTLCASEMLRTQTHFIINEGNTIGLVQRKIIILSTTVDEITSTFANVDKMMKPSSDGVTPHPYSVADIDFFVIEAHNRACSLMFMGDISNAEKLLVISLNLLPLGSKEVESFGPAIRRTYRAVLGRKGVGAGFMSMSAHDLVSLLEG